MKIQPSNSKESKIDDNDSCSDQSIFHYHRGDLCPACGNGRLDYDGLLNLSCPLCGYVYPTSGSFT